MNKTLLISETTLKNNSVITDNVDMKMLLPSIQYVQDAILQPLLGTRLYRDIQSQVAAGTISQETKELLDDHIENILIYGVMAEVPTDLLLKMMNLTVGRAEDDGITSATLRQVSFLRDHNKGKMQFYAKRMNDFLCFNTTKYPLFTQGQNEEMRANREPYTTGIAGLDSLWGKKYDRDGNKLPAQVRYRDLTIDLTKRR